MMVGRGRGRGRGRGDGRSGRGSGASGQKKKTEQKFHTSSTGVNKTKYANYTAVKDVAILKMQKTLHDEVIASVREEELVDMNDSKPIRKWSDKKAEAQENLQYQDEYKIEFEMWGNECRTFKREEGLCASV